MRHWLDDVREGARRGVAAAEVAMFVHDLCNHPSNVMTPTRIAAVARKIGRERGVRVKILERPQVERLGVAKRRLHDAHHPRRLVVQRCFQDTLGEPHCPPNGQATARGFRLLRVLKAS